MALIDILRKIMPDKKDEIESFADELEKLENPKPAKGNKEDGGSNFENAEIARLREQNSNLKTQIADLKAEKATIETKYNDVLTVKDTLEQEKSTAELLRKADDKRQADLKADEFIQSMITSGQLEKDNAAKQTIWKGKYLEDPEGTSEMAKSIPPIIDKAKQGETIKATTNNINQHSPLGSIVPAGIAALNDNVQPYN